EDFGVNIVSGLCRPVSVLNGLIRFSVKQCEIAPSLHHICVAFLISDTSLPEFGHPSRHDVLDVHSGGWLDLTCDMACLFNSAQRVARNVENSQPLPSEECAECIIVRNSLE